MKILLSPAKSLDYDLKIETPFTEQAHFLKEADYLAKKLQKKSKKELGTLMKLSENLSDLNHKRYQEWEEPTVLNENAQPAVTVFTGEVYKGLDVGTFSEKDFKNAQKDLMILSGLYGILKPLDLMYPYRLEMGTRWNITPNTKNLYNYWASQLADFINKETKENEVIVNLASNEYFKAVDKKILKPRIVTPVFKDLKGDQFKIIMMYAKHARGAMARDIIQNQYQDIEGLKGYNVDGYSYKEDMSTEDEWFFVR
ncbi:MAG TPA: peroxide stress protein YaaA [Brumimicrobium sp.]|nr:peroxide stress protein YaaA [Brumimicrobium sp.]